MASNTNFNILIGCTGSVASIKIPKLASAFTSLGYYVVIVPTFNAFHFLRSEAVASCRVPDPKKYGENCSCDAYLQYKKNCSDEEEVNTINFLKPCVECETKSLYPEFVFATDKEEWQSWKGRGDPVKHIELRDWADILVLAPLGANTLAKIAQGLCDNLLTCIVRAWNMTKPVLFCPAMNTQMYIHPFTSQHINILKELGFKEVEVTSKILICGEKGIGAMAEVEVIIERVKELVLKDS